MAEFGNPEVVQEELDILLIGGGMACCGAAYEVMRWAEVARQIPHTELAEMILEESGEVKIYYGAADAVEALASVHVDDLVTLCKPYPQA